MKDALIRKAIGLLSLAGVEYAVQMPSGEIVGKLFDEPAQPVAPPPATPPVAEPAAPVYQAAPQTRPKLCRARGADRRDWLTLFPDYPKQIKNMPEGGKLDWQLPDLRLAVSFQKCVTSVAHHAFGSRKYMTSVDPKTHTITLIRL